ncbi:MAG TPA: hypothetical protein PLC39_01305 [Methanomassiliicoccales archaeon]|nr:hypothetical protein [Methanomassiliicoccales archaeon]HNX47649.1 hypothetical protein [Methanomassiliicoccales archaeon]HPR97922.1 hypothetical protein [Methanomassiliicoccales archaeon]
MERRVRVAGGKTLVLDVDCQGEEVVRIRISGDFFFYPEEGLAKLESFLVEEKVWKANDPGAIIADYLSENDLRAVGFGPSDLAFLLRGSKC